MDILLHFSYFLSYSVLGVEASIRILQLHLSFSSPPSQKPMKYCSFKNRNPRWELLESPVPHLLMTSGLTGGCYLSFIHFLFQGMSNENHHNP